MGRPRSLTAKSIKQLVHEQRVGLYAAGHQNLNMTLPNDVVARIDGWKQRYRLGSRDVVVARVIRQCMATTALDAFVLRPSPRPTEVRRISPIVPGELAAYVKTVQSRFRGIAYGPVFEMIAAAIGADLCVEERPDVANNRDEPQGVELPA